MGSKIREISKFQNNTEIALVDEILQNLRQMEVLGVYFRKKIEILNFHNIFNVLYAFEHSQDPIFWVLSKNSKISGFWKPIS